jgi:TonB-linked SusC/RagA family outer membrane protein
MGLSGRVTYAFDSKYFTEFNFGYNGSERFAKNHRFGFFPSVGVGYALSNESFWAGIKETVSLLKLKATYGLVGNDAIADERERFLYLSNVNLIDGAKGYNWGYDYGNYYDGYTVNRYPNSNITWEIAEKTNAGIELGLFEKLTLQADYFSEKRTNIYMENQYVPASIGLSSAIKSNIGEAKSHGVDASLDYQQSFTNGGWITARANFTYATNEVLVNGEPEYEYDYMSQIGHPIDQQWGLVAERLFVDENEVLNSPVQTYGNNYMAGDIKYVDVNEDGQIDDNDRVPLGYPTTPEIVYGFGVSAGYKNIDFSFFFQGSARSSFFIDPSAIAPFVNERNALEVIADNHWSDLNPDPNAFWPRLSTELVENNTQPSSWWLRNGSFLRLKSVEVGYSLPSKLMEKWGMKETRFYLSGTNLLTFSKFDLWDPEMGGFGMGYPPQMLINIGVNVSL